jgi:adenine-specific DNA methylase
MMGVSCNTLCRWESTRQLIADVFARQALPMMWDYAELNPFGGGSGSWKTVNIYSIRYILHASSIATPAMITQSSATSLPYPSNHFDAVITDPPYYDNVPYSYLSDFFYVWLKRTIGDLYPDLFATPLTPKSEEIVAYSYGEGGFEEGKRFFEKMITKAFQEIYRVLKPEGIAYIVFAYKTTEAWETIINSLLKSGLVLTASWPVHTEMKERLRAQESAALASSIYMVCRKRTKEETAYFNEIKEKIKQRVREKLEQFWEQGISGADFFVSAIGPAVEVFGQYSKVEKLSGEEVSTKELLEYVRKVVSEFALERVLKKADLGGIDAQTRFYLLWRWTFGNAKVLFDEAVKLSRSLGVELIELWDKGGLVRKEKESTKVFIRVLNPMERAKDEAFLKKTKFTSMIDVLHYVLILWERGEKEKIKQVLNETGYARNELFWQTAQALSEILPEGDKEKQLIQGLLYGRGDYIKGHEKGTLLDFIGGES